MEAQLTNQEHEFDLVLNALNDNIISTLEMRAFIRNVFSEKFHFCDLRQSIANYFPTWSEMKVASLVFRVDAIRIMSDKQQLSGWADFSNKTCYVDHYIFLAAAQCPLIEDNEDFVFEPAYLLRRSFELRNIDKERPCKLTR